MVTSYSLIPHRGCSLAYWYNIETFSIVVFPFDYLLTKKYI